MVGEDPQKRHRRFKQIEKTLPPDPRVVRVLGLSRQNRVKFPDVASCRFDRRYTVASIALRISGWQLA